VLTLAPPEPCLALYPWDTWEAICERLDAAPVKDEAFRRFVRDLFSHTHEVSCDTQGRLLIPPDLRAKAGIEREAASVGVLSRVEVWNPERLRALRSSQDDAARLSTELGLY
jgi:MraZ protein